MRASTRFKAELRIAGINPYVDVPAAVVAAVGNGADLRVLVRTASAAQAADADFADAKQLIAIGRLTDDGWFRTTLVRPKSDPVRLYVDRWMRASAGVDVGDEVSVTLAADPDPREPEMPAALAEALADDDVAADVWATLTPSRRREILSYLGFLKTPAALERNVEKVMLDLRHDPRPR